MRPALVLLLFGISMSAQTNVATAFPDTAELVKMAGRFAPTPLKIDISGLDPGDRKALIKAIQAGHVIDDIFLQQLWSGNEKLYRQLRKDDSPLGRARLHMFWINKGPWSDLDEHRAFIPGVPERKPLGANFYPENLTREEFEHWTAGLPEQDAEEA